MSPPATARTRWRYPYEPTERQQVAHSVVADELLYGGAAGGGKSEFLLAAHVMLAVMVPGSQSVIFRRTFGALERSLIPRLRERIPREVGTYHAGKHLWTFRNGSTIELAHLQHESDVLRYQGVEYQLISFDELTQFTETQYVYLRTRLRAAGHVLAQMDKLGWRPRIQAAANPGGPGHHWVKRRFIDPAPPGQVWRPFPTLDDPRPGVRVFVPAKITDNPHIDAGYVDRLAEDPILRRALRDGDWDILEGVRFTGWRRGIHVIDPEQLPVGVTAGHPRAVGVDYGIDAPFSAHWGAKMGDGLIVVYREVYEAGLTPRLQAAAIRDAEAEGERGPGRHIPIALDPSTWARDPNTGGGKLGPIDKNTPPPNSIADAYVKVFGSAVVKAKNWRREGAAAVDDKLRVRADGWPRILIYSTCTALIRTLPALPRAKRDPEDVDTTAEDHAYDSLRYLLMELDPRLPQREQGQGEGGGVSLIPSSTGLAGAGF